MSALGRVLPIAVQHARVRYLGIDSLYMGKLTFRSSRGMPGPGQEESFGPPPATVS